ncbi:hypothetical protein B7494_g206 [Chlorociboria aeruginascens]|nr:hypothetical protein B7494_g206 [Chlorociboria aeruginascens]
MSSRRSARLSAASPGVKEESKLTNGSIAKAAPKTSLKEAAKVAPKANVSRKRKPLEEAIEPLLNGNDAGPSTPKRKKAVKTPVTPTLSGIPLMTTPYKPEENNNGAFLAVDRLAVPNGTNAPLVSPETHRLVANKPVDQVSPSKASTVKTTGKLLDEAIAHIIKIEPKLKPIVEKYPCEVFSPEGLAKEIDPFNALVSGIISQQVSGAAAKSIKTKFIALFYPPDSDPETHIFPTPSAVVTKDIATLRTAGLSQRKAEYVHGLAEKFSSGELTTSMLFSATYEEVFEELIKVRGLGKWSVEMFACFSLKRMDVFSTGDLGVQRGMAALMGKDVGKLKGKGGKWKYMSEKEMEEIADRFKPYRSVFMWYMWRVEEIPVIIKLYFPL